MPRKHVLVIFVVILVCCACAACVDKYASSMHLIRRIVLEKSLEPSNDRQLFDGMLTGMMSSLDRFSGYIPPEEFQEFNATLSQEFGGLGLTFGLSETTNRPTVFFVMPDAPAAQAGIKADDILVSVDGVSLKDKNITEISALLRGAVDSSVMLSVERPSEQKTLSFSIVRRKIQTETVEGDVRRPDGTWEFILPEMPEENPTAENATPTTKKTAETDSTATPTTPTVENAAVVTPAAESTTPAVENTTVAVENQPATENEDDELLEDSAEETPTKPKIAYVRITSFGERTSREMARCLSDLRKQNLTGLVLDLRDNAGGLLNAAVEICDLFLDSGVIVSIRGREKNLINAYNATQGKIWNPEIPITILLNENSASASEIMAACLQDYGEKGVLKVVCVGTRSYGKGTVQQLIDLGPIPGDRDLSSNGDFSTASLWKRLWEKPKRGALKLTMASYWRPSEKNIHRFADATEDDVWGVMPNEGLTVAFPDPAKSKKEEKAQVAALEQQRNLRWNGQMNPEDAPRIFALDPQLKKAVSWLREQ